MNRKDRAARYREIRSILEKGAVGSQEELLRRLEGRGYRVTQATLSRDLRALAAGKVPDGGGGYRYALPGETAVGPSTASGSRQVVLQGFLWMAFSGGNGLIKTLPGFANSIASGLDGLGIPEVLGTIAGDDTILVVPRDGISRSRLIKALIQRMPELKDRLA